MGICPGQAPIAIHLFYPRRVKLVPSEKDSCGILVDLFESVTAFRSVNYAFSVEVTTQTAFENIDGG